jgi:hypothetical protein
VCTLAGVLRWLGLVFVVEHLGMATTSVLFPFARARFGWDHQPYAVYRPATTSAAPARDDGSA